MIVGVPESFELELETDGNEALKRYRERGPYDLVLSDLRLPGLSGPDLARAIRSKNPAQRIVMITESLVPGVQLELGDIQLELGDIPVINRHDPRTAAAMKRARLMSRYEDTEGKALLDRVEAAVEATYKKVPRKRASRGNGKSHSVAG